MQRLKRVFAMPQATLIDGFARENGSDGIVAYLGSILVLQGGEFRFSQESGVVGKANSTLEMRGVDTGGNHGDGIVLMTGSKLILEEPHSVSYDNDNFGLYCGDDESSISDLTMLDTNGPVGGTGFQGIR